MALEDPTQRESRDDLRALGLEIVEIPVDESGMRVDMLDAADVDAVVVTAAHQYPTGGVLPPERGGAPGLGRASWRDDRRGRLRRRFRYDREPIGAIQGLSPDRVVYAGSASKILAPGLRLGWFIVPAALAERVTLAKWTADLGSPAIDQLAFADFLARGELDRHLRRLRPIYRARRDILLASLARHLPELRPVGASAGLHVLAWLPPELEEAAIVEGALRARHPAPGVGPRAAGPTAPGGLTFGYGTIRSQRTSRGSSGWPGSSPRFGPEGAPSP